MNITVKQEGGLLSVTATGGFTLEDAQRAFLEILDAAAKHRSTQVIFDGLGLTGEPTTMQRFFYGKFAALAAGDFNRQTGLSTPQFAYVLKVPVLDPTRFGETVAVNRGMNVRAFDNLEDARHWLEPSSR